jgi:hypothetical protein
MQVRTGVVARFAAHGNAHETAEREARAKKPTAIEALSPVPTQSRYEVK